MNRMRPLHMSGAIAIAVALGGCAPTPTLAQSRDFSELSSRMDRLQRDVDTLSRTVYQCRTPPPAAPGGALPADTRFQADMQVRLDQLESQISAANGRAEAVTAISTSRAPRARGTWIRSKTPTTGSRK